MGLNRMEFRRSILFHRDASDGEFDMENLLDLLITHLGMAPRLLDLEHATLVIGDRIGDRTIDIWYAKGEDIEEDARWLAASYADERVDPQEVARCDRKVTVVYHDAFDLDTVDVAIELVLDLSSLLNGIIFDSVRGEFL